MGTGIRATKQKGLGVEGAFTRFKGLVAPSVGEGPPGGKPLGGLANGNSVTSAPPTSRAGLATSQGHLPPPQERPPGALGCFKLLCPGLMAKHVNSNPLCDLTPIFKDSEKYLASTEQQSCSGGSGTETESKPVGCG